MAVNESRHPEEREEIHWAYRARLLQRPGVQETEQDRRLAVRHRSGYDARARCTVPACHTLIDMSWSNWLAPELYAH